MPTYDFRCPTCNDTISIHYKLTDTINTPSCAKCAAVMLRTYTSPAVTFKGTGWGKDK